MTCRNVQTLGRFHASEHQQRRKLRAPPPLDRPNATSSGVPGWRLTIAHSSPDDSFGYPHHMSPMRRPLSSRLLSSPATTFFRGE